MLKKFHQDPYYILKYLTLNLLIYAPACFALYKYSSISPISHFWIIALCILPLVLPSFFPIIGTGFVLMGATVFFNLAEYSLWHLALIPLGVYVGFNSGFLMHNATHGSIRPVWLNRVIGEFFGLHQLMGFPGWAVVHLLHHLHPDDPKRDPHSPENLTFWEFLHQMGVGMVRVFTEDYFMVWGTGLKYKRIWRGIQIISPFVRYFRALFLLLLFGPIGFVFFYIPSKITTVLSLAHFNYYTHRPLGKDQFQILNLNHNFIYKFLNIMICGTYFHKNHHLKPFLFNPRYLKDDNKSLISYAAPLVQTPKYYSAIAGKD